MKKENKTDWVKIKGIIGLFLTIGALIGYKLLALYHSGISMLAIILTVLGLYGIYLWTPYIGRIMKEGS